MVRRPTKRRAKPRKQVEIKTINVTLPTEGFVRQNVVLAIFGLTKTTLWRWISENRFPRGIKLGPGVTAWDVSTLREHMAKIRGGAA